MDFQVIFTTARSFVLELLEDNVCYNSDRYEIVIDGEKYMESDKVIQTVYGLTPDTAYQVAVKRNGQVSETKEVRTRYEFVTLNVRDFGAKGDGVSDDTAYLQAAIMSCPQNSRVYVPKGMYRFTNLFLKSDLTLELAEGAELIAIPDKTKLAVLPGRIQSYDEAGEYLIASWEGNPLDSFASILTGIQVKNVVICGRGSINGSADFDNWWNVEKRKGDPARPKMMFLNNCENVVLQGITIKNSPSWNMHPCFSKDIRFLDIAIQSPADSHNTDGIDPESCENVEIAGVYFSVGDDCIAIKSGKMYMGKKYKTPSKHIVVRNCYMNKGHGAVTIGSEISGGVDDIQIRNCVFFHTDRGLRVKTRRGRGKDSVLRGIVFDNIRMEHVRSAFVINSFYYCGPDGKTEYVSSKEPLPVDERTPSVKDVRIRNVECADTHVAGVYFYGLPEQKIEQVEMENVHITYAEDAEAGTAAMMQGCEPTCRKGIFARNIEKLTMKNVVIEGCDGEPLDIEAVDEVIRG